MRISERLLTVLAICLLVTAVPAFARGKGERELKQSQELIDRKQYSEAIRLLSGTLKDFPDLREQINKQVAQIADLAGELVKERKYAEAMKLLVQIIEVFPDLRRQADRVVAEIMAARERFNEKYKELLAVIREVPPDVELGLAIIKELTDLDPNPDEAIVESINIARQKLVSAGKYQLFTVTMDAASALIKDGKLREAIKAYRENVFPVARADFDTAPHPPLLREQALSVVRSLEEAARQAETQLDAPATLPAALDALLAAPVTDAGREDFAGKLQLLAQARELEERIRELGIDLRDVNAAIDTANGADGFKDLWLGFVEQAALGRKELPPEGIAFAARQPWVDTAGKLSEAAYAASERAFEDLDKLLAGKVDLPAFRSRAAEARSRGLLALEVLMVEDPAWRPAEGVVLSDKDTARAVDLSKRIGRVRQRMADVDAWEPFLAAEEEADRRLADLDRRIRLVPSPTNAELSQLSQGRGELADIQKSAGSGTDEWTKRAADATSGSVMATRAAAVRDRFTASATRAFEADLGFAARIAELDIDRLDQRLKPLESLTSADTAQLTKGRTELADIQKSAETGESDWDSWAGRVTPDSAIAVRAAAVRNKYAGLVSRALKAVANIAERIARIEYEAGSFEQRLVDAEKVRAEGIADAEGKRPDRAFEKFAAAAKDFDDILKGMNTWHERWAIAQVLSSSSVIAGLDAEQAGRSERIDTLKRQIKGEKDSAQNAVSEANDLSRFADEGRNEARELVREKRYDEARDRFKVAKENYERSLDIMENAEVRRRYDSLVGELAAVDAESKKQGYIEVNNLIALGSDLRTGNEPKKAVDTLERAKILWDSISPGERNENLEYQLAIARAALSATGKRVLDPTDPMYEDVRGFMTQAYLSYNGAVKLVKTPPPSTEAQRYIDAALASLQPITTAVPEYLEARLLRMKINQLQLGKRGFEAEFRKLVPDAIARFQKPGATPAELYQLYLELIDYHSFKGAKEILGSAAFAQMQKAINTYEWANGIAERPLTPVEIETSNNRYGEANTKYLANKLDIQWYDWILNKLAESLKNNRGNEKALQLQGIVIGLRGGPQQLMSYPHITRYQEAIRLAARGDKPRARLIVEPLLNIYPLNPPLGRLWDQIK